MIKLETQANNGDILAGTGPFTQAALACWDPATGPRVLQDCGLIVDSFGNNLDHKTASGTINIGATNASIINIGKSGATVNIIGTTNYIQTTNTQVSDKLITLNKGGGAGTAGATGIEFEEDNVITGYLKTSSDRKSFQLLAPDTAGIVTITPGAAGFTLDDTIVKSSSSSVTDNTIARFDLTTGKLIQSTGVSIDDNNDASGIRHLSFTGNLTTGASATITLNTGLSGPLKAASGVVSAAAIALGGAEVSGQLGIGNGGTGAATALAAFDALSPMTTRGDLITRGATNNARLALGTQYHVLQAGATDPAYGLITNNNIDASAAIAASKLSLSGSIGDTEIKASGVANIAWNKLASGTANYPMITSASGYPTTEQYLDKTRGGTGITSTATFPASGTIATGTGTNNKLPKFTTGASGVLGDSTVSDDGTTLATTLKTLQLGDGTTSGDRSIVVDRGATDVAIRWNETTDKWQYTNDGTLYKDMGSASGSSGINYCTNGTAEDNATTGWATYVDAAGTSPVDGTGGSPTTTFTVNSTTPLRGTYDFVLTKDAANRQGEGASYDFTIDKADYSKPLKITFDYAYSANFSIANGDIAVFVYSRDGSVLVPVTPNALDGSGKFYGEFQTEASPNNDYRLILHIATTNANAWTFNIDNVVIGVEATRQITPVTDWVAWTPTGSWTTNTTYTGMKRRVGDTGEYKVLITLGGAPTSANLDIDLPPGEVLDTVKDIFDANETRSYGEVTIADATGNVYYGTVGYKSASDFYIWYLDAAATNSITTQAAPFTFASGDKISINFRCPIAGWGSSVTASQDADTRIIAARYYGNAGNVITKLTEDIEFTTKEKDTHASWSGTSFTCPVAGFYKINGGVFSTAAQANNIAAYVNGTLKCYLSSPTANTSSHILTGNIYLNVADVLSFRFDQTDQTLNSAVTNSHYISIIRDSGPAFIAASEKVYARYTSNSGQTINTATETTYLYEDKVVDSHNAYNTSTGYYTCPKSGVASITATWMPTASTGWEVSELPYIAIDKNDATVGRIRGIFPTSDMSGASDYPLTCFITVDSLPVNAGDTIRIRVYQSNDANLNTVASAEYNTIAIRII